uniref:Uncharacterized protein n=1 Tax=Mycena chlorophos TaxID=658473 RepID=A0ABQ0LG18_MYCCL|nr:predicted protein [Mycena chlorophos]
MRKVVVRSGEERPGAAACSVEMRLLREARADDDCHRSISALDDHGLAQQLRLRLPHLLGKALPILRPTASTALATVGLKPAVLYLRRSPSGVAVAAASRPVSTTPNAHPRCRSLVPATHTPTFPVCVDLRASALHRWAARQPLGVARRGLATPARSRPSTLYGVSLPSTPTTVDVASSRLLSRCVCRWPWTT